MVAINKDSQEIAKDKGALGQLEVVTVDPYLRAKTTLKGKGTQGLMGRGYT